MAASCIFCKIIKGEIPSMKLFESERTFAFLDINPLSSGHAVRDLNQSELASADDSMIAGDPKIPWCELTDIPDESLQELLPVAKRIANAAGAIDFNILQNNGRIAHQMVDHVHVHMIPKPNQQEGLGITWPQQNVNKEQLQKLLEEIKAKM